VLQETDIISCMLFNCAADRYAKCNQTLMSDCFKINCRMSVRLNSTFTHVLTLAHASVLHYICWIIEVRNAKLSGWNLVVCGTEHHPHQRLSYSAARPVHAERSRSNEAKPSYAVYPQNMQQRPQLRPAADFRAVYMGPCRKPTTHYDSSLRKNGDSRGKAATVCRA